MVDAEKQLELKLPFASEETALLVYKVLNVDKEIARSKSKRTIALNENKILVKFTSHDLKSLRVALNALIKNVILIMKTIKLDEELNVQLNT